MERIDTKPNLAELFERNEIYFIAINYGKIGIELDAVDLTGDWPDRATIIKRIADGEYGNDISAVMEVYRAFEGRFERVTDEILAEAEELNREDDRPERFPNTPTWR